MAACRVGIALPPTSGVSLSPVTATSVRLPSASTVRVTDTSPPNPAAVPVAVRVEDLDGYPLISLPHNIGQQPAVDWAVNRRVQTVPDFLLDAADRPFLMRLVQTGKAISFNSGWHYKEYPGIRRIDPVDLDLTIHAYVLCRRDAARTLALERFCAYVRTVSADQTAAG